MPASSPFLAHHWTTAEFNAVAAAGAFPAAVELIEGAIVDMAPMGTQHSAVVTLVGLALQAAFPANRGFVERYQLPLALTSDTQPQPDLAVVQGSPRDFLLAHPGRADLMVEVADSSLTYDRTVKQWLYAQAAIPEYWIVNLADEVVEVHGDPRSDGRGSLYQTIRSRRRGERITPRAMPGAALLVDDLLP